MRGIAASVAPWDERGQEASSGDDKDHHYKKVFCPGERRQLLQSYPLESSAEGEKKTQSLYDLNKTTLQTQPGGFIIGALLLGSLAGSPFRSS